MEKITGFEIKPEERQSWGLIDMVWIGSMICVPALMVSGMLGSGLSLGSCLAAIPALAFWDHPFFIGLINGIVVAMVVYIVIQTIPIAMTSNQAVYS